MRLVDLPKARLDAVGREHGLDVSDGELDVPHDVHGEPRRLWDCEAEVKSDYSRYTAKSDEKAPASIHSYEALVALGYDRVLISR